MFAFLSYTETGVIFHFASVTFSLKKHSLILFVKKKTVTTWVTSLTRDHVKEKLSTSQSTYLNFDFCVSFLSILHKACYHVCKLLLNQTPLFPHFLNMNQVDTKISSFCG